MNYSMYRRDCQCSCMAYSMYNRNLNMYRLVKALAYECICVRVCAYMRVRVYACTRICECSRMHYIMYNQHLNMYRNAWTSPDQKLQKMVGFQKPML